MVTAKRQGTEETKNLNNQHKIFNKPRIQHDSFVNICYVGSDKIAKYYRLTKENLSKSV